MAFEMAPRAPTAIKIKTTFGGRCRDVSAGIPVFYVL
jgi:hypothetical protein